MTNSLEQLLRDDLAAIAARTPDAHGLADAALRRARDKRRRRAVWGAAASLVLVVALGGTALVAGRGTAPAAVPPATSPSATAPVSTEVFGGVLHYRGAEVPVPRAWLHTDNLICYTAIRDAAYVIGPGWGSNLCAPPTGLDRSGITEVTLARWGWPGPETGEHVLRDGRTQLVTRVPAADVRFIVTSPDPELARRIFDGLVVDAPGDCAGVWLTSSRGDTARVSETPGESTLTVRVGDTVTAQSNGPCPSLSVQMEPDGVVHRQAIAPRDESTAGTALIADRAGTVRVTATAAMCDGLDPGCAGGVALLGSVDVTVR